MGFEKKTTNKIRFEPLAPAVLKYCYIANKIDSNLYKIYSTLYLGT